MWKGVDGPEVHAQIKVTRVSPIYFLSLELWLMALVSCCR